MRFRTLAIVAISVSLGLVLQWWLLSVHSPTAIYWCTHEEQRTQLLALNSPGLFVAVMLNVAIDLAQGTSIGDTVLPVHEWTIWFGVMLEWTILGGLVALVSARLPRVRR